MGYVVMGLIGYLVILLCFFLTKKYMKEPEYYRDRIKHNRLISTYYSTLAALVTIYIILGTVISNV